MKVILCEHHRLVSLEADTEGDRIGSMLGINMCDGKRKEVECREEVKLHRGSERASIQAKALEHMLSSRGS